MNIDRARLFDKRVVQRNIRAGRVTKEEYRAWLGELSDTSDKIKPRDEGGDDDGYEPHSAHASVDDASAEQAAPASHPSASTFVPAAQVPPPSGEAS